MRCAATRERHLLAAARSPGGPAAAAACPHRGWAAGADRWRRRRVSPGRGSAAVRGPGDDVEDPGAGAACVREGRSRRTPRGRPDGLGAVPAVPRPGRHPRRPRLVPVPRRRPARPVRAAVELPRPRGERRHDNAAHQRDHRCGTVPARPAERADRRRDRRRRSRRPLPRPALAGPRLEEVRSAFSAHGTAIAALPRRPGAGRQAPGAGRDRLHRAQRRRRPGLRVRRGLGDQGGHGPGRGDRHLLLGDRDQTPGRHGASRQPREPPHPRDHRRRGRLPRALPRRAAAGPQRRRRFRRRRALLRPGPGAGSPGQPR